QISVSLTEVVAAGETPETTTIDKTINVSAGKYETALTGEALTGTTASTIGTKPDDRVRGIEFNLDDLGDRSGLIFINESGGLTVKNGVYYFNLVFNHNHQAYLVEEVNEGTYYGLELARYNELLGRYFLLGADAATITVYELDQSGSREIAITRDESGNITSSSLNGGYHVVNGGYLFVDDAAVTDANAGILYLIDRAAVVTPDGHVYPVAIEGNTAGGDMNQETISFSSNMSQMTDSYGRLVYSVVQYQYRDPNNEQIKYFMSSGSGDETYDNIYNMLADWGYYYSSSLIAATAYRTVGDNPYEGYYYDINSVPIYNLRVPKTNANGDILYSVFNVVTGKYLEGEFTEDQTSGYWGYGRYQVNMIYRDIDGLNIVRPVTGGFTVTCTEPCRFSIPEDEKEYGIVSEHVRVLLDNDGMFEAGTVLYLDENKNIIALYNPDGKFYRYEQDTYYTPGNTGDQEIYTAYRGEGSGETLDLITYCSAGSQIMLHEVMTGLYMATPDESDVTTFSLTTMNSFYADADYFGIDGAGNLVMLEKEVLDAPYESTGEVDQDFDGAALMRIYDPAGNLLLRILELADGRIVFLFDDNTWIDSKGNTGFIPRPVNRTLSGYDNTSQIQVNQVSAQNVNISFAGANTTLTDNGNEGNINIISDNVIIAAKDSGSIYTADNPLVIAPNRTDTVNLRLIKTSSGGAYDASAYVVASRAGDNVNLHNTDIADGGLLDLTVAGGDAAMNNVGLNAGGTINLSVGSGDITMNEVEVSGDLSAAVTAGDVNMNEVSVSSTGKLDIISGEGDVIVDQVTADNTLQITTSDGSLLMKDEDSILTIGKHSTAAAGDTWVDIAGDIGTADLPFKVNIELGEAGEVQPVNVKNAVNIYLKQETGIDSGNQTLPTYGRDENGNIGNHDEAASAMEADDQTVNVVMPAQTTEELTTQLSNSNLNEEQLLALISGILTGTEIKSLLGIDDTAVARLVSALEAMDTAELAALVSSLNLGVAGPETELDLTVLDGDDPQALEDLAVKLGLPAAADKDDILARLRSKLGLADTAGVEAIKAGYQTYYDGLLAQYRSDVVDSYRASIEDKLDADSRLTDADIKYLLDLGLSEEAAVVTVLLAAALEAQQPVVVSDDGAGNVTYLQATDQDGNLLYVDGIDENGDPIQIPVYVMESRLKDHKLFAAYWDSLTEEEKLDLIQAAWVLADYPEAEGSANQPRILILNIGKSTGNSSIYNLGDIIVTQQEGTFTAEEVISRYGDVALTSPDIAGVDGKTNVYGEEISLTATTGSISGLNVEQKSWPLTTIANIEDEDKKNEVFGQTGGNTWVLVRNPVTGEVE
ncbi:MAG: hypothetical protein PHE82_08410, partial [Syntrophomonadaceae bacterium]|nr:hypothetical protein [Syntrophomonadaceae bacterium]